MNRQDIRTWLERNATMMPETRFTADDLDHVAECMEHLVRWYFEDYPLGDFLTAVVKNNFTEACFRADEPNRKALYLYALFLYNKMPAEWREKANPELKKQSQA